MCCISFQWWHLNMAVEFLWELNSINELPQRLSVDGAKHVKWNNEPFQIVSAFALSQTNQYIYLYIQAYRSLSNTLAHPLCACVCYCVNLLRLVKSSFLYKFLLPKYAICVFGSENERKCKRVRKTERARAIDRMR